jgi:hypothetical protein
MIKEKCHIKKKENTLIKINLDQSHTKKKEELLIIRKADKNMKALEKEEKGIGKIHLPAESHAK